MRRSTTLIAGLAVAALLAAGCSDSGDDDAGGTTTSTTEATTTSPPTTGTTTSSSSASSSSSSTSSTAPSTQCGTNELSAELGPTNAGAGQVYQALVLRNTGSRTCETRGFPGVSILDGSGQQIGQPADREGTEGPSVSLAPGEAASAQLHTANEGIPGAPCEATSAQMKVFPPGETEAITFAAAYQVCGSWTVGTLYPGETGLAP